MRISDWSSDLCSSDLDRYCPGWRYPGNDADFPKYPPARTIAIRHSTPTRSTAAMMPANKPIALTRFLIEEQRAGRINADLRLLIEVVARACKSISQDRKSTRLNSSP